MEYVFGYHALEEALNGDKTVEKVQIDKTKPRAAYAELAARLKKDNIPLQYLPSQAFNKYKGKNHQGVIGVISPIEYTTIAEVLENKEPEQLPHMLVFDHITDVRNMGALCRSALCFGFEVVLMPQKGQAAVNADAVKTSAGALLKMDICREDNLITSLEYLQQMGYELVCISEKAKHPISKLHVNGPMALIVGNEEKGINPKIMQITNHQFFIPMSGKLDSLNVSVAGAIAMSTCFAQM